MGQHEWMAIIGSVIGAGLWLFGMLAPYADGAMTGTNRFYFCFGGVYVAFLYSMGFLMDHGAIP